jgi:hypothetical protein
MHLHTIKAVGDVTREVEVGLCSVVMHVQVCVEGYICCSVLVFTLELN